MNMCTHKSRCVVSLLHNLLFMKAKLLKVLSSSTKPKTCTIISTTFMYSFSFKTKNGEDWIFNHIWVIAFTFDGFYIIASTLSLMAVWNKKLTHQTIMNPKAQQLLHHLWSFCQHIMQPWSYPNVGGSSW
jgi:hypothetical protein